LINVLIACICLSVICVACWLKITALKKLLKYDILKNEIKLLKRENLLLEEDLKKCKINKLNTNLKEG